MKRVLLVEDDSKLSNHLTKLIQQEGMAPYLASNSSELSEVLASKQEVDLVLLDRLLDGVDTKMKVREIKSKWPTAHILVLSAVSTPIERAELINLGVDDYMGKPFLSQELVARLKALSRRYSAPSETYRQIGNSVLDLMRRTISVLDKTDHLPGKEYQLLKILTDEVGRVMTRNDLLDLVWGMSTEVETNVVEATITHLRKRLASIGSSIEIKNMRNSGYWVEG